MTLNQSLELLISNFLATGSTQNSHISLGANSVEEALLIKLSASKAASDF
jgi:hypothetical protein